MASYRNNWQIKTLKWINTSMKSFNYVKWLLINNKIQLQIQIEIINNSINSKKNKNIKPTKNAVKVDLEFNKYNNNNLREAEVMIKIVEYKMIGGN